MSVQMTWGSSRSSVSQRAAITTLGATFLFRTASPLLAPDMLITRVNHARTR
jgi:hypothetical protein